VSASVADGTVAHVRACETCRADISHKRADARYCDRTCKVRASDARRKADGRAKARDRARYLRESGRRRRQALEWYWRNPERARELTRQYRLENPERRRAADDRRRDLIESHPDYRPFPRSEWERALRRARHACTYCGATGVPLEMDHIVPISRGGRHAIANVTPACKTCNASKHNKLLSEWRLESLRSALPA